MPRGGRSFPQSPPRLLIVGRRCYPVLSDPQARVDYLRGCNLSQPRPWMNSFESRGYVRESQSCDKRSHLTNRHITRKAQAFSEIKTCPFWPSP